MSNGLAIVELAADGAWAVPYQGPRSPSPFANRKIMAAGASGDDGSDPTSFEQRVLAKEVDLLKYIEEGVPPIEYLPASNGMLVRGKRHLIAAPRKEGKSISMLAHFVREALAGTHIVILDRENGAQVYGERLQAIITAYGLKKPHKETVRANLRYFEFPRLRPEDREAFARVMSEWSIDVVVFDSQRKFLTDFGLKEDVADEYSEFMEYVVDPLFFAGVATVILDNTGHKETGRSRGTSAKGDLNEVLMTIETVIPFSRNRQGKVRIKLAPGDSRFGNEGEWEMDIGGGAFSPWQGVGETVPDDPDFRRICEELLRFAAQQSPPKTMTQTALLREVRARGVQFRNQDGRERLYRYAADEGDPIMMFPPDKEGLPASFYWDGTGSE